MNYNMCEIIIPPDSLKPIIEKTIEYVVRNGVNFESELRKRNVSGGNKFGFLMSDHDYYPYYKKYLNLKLNPEQIEKLRILRLKDAEKVKNSNQIIQKQTMIRTLSLTEKIQQEIRLYRIPKEKYIQHPRINKYTVVVPKGIKPLQVDLIKLTAQFVARNGRKFLTNLTSKEQNNHEFEFLDPVHPFFPYFQKLVNAYCLCIVPPKDLLKRLKIDQNFETLLLESVGEAEYLRQEEDNRIQKEADEEEERMQMQLIDWHRFVVLETLDFNEGEIYPPPGLTIQEINEILNTNNQAEIKFTLADDINENQEMDMDMDMDQSEILDVREKELKNNKLYNNIKKKKNLINDDDDLGAIPEIESIEETNLRNEMELELKRRAANNNRVESPFTGDMIPLSEISEHIRIMLLNPQWKEQKEILIDKMRTTSLADNREIALNLNKFTIKQNELNSHNSKIKNHPELKSTGCDSFQYSRKANESISIEELNRKKLKNKNIKDDIYPIDISQKDNKKVTFYLSDGTSFIHEIKKNMMVEHVKFEICKKIEKSISQNKIIMKTDDDIELTNGTLIDKYNIKGKCIFLKFLE